jgi:hypothetical protein
MEEDGHPHINAPSLFLPQYPTSPHAILLYNLLKNKNKNKNKNKR